MRGHTIRARREQLGWTIEAVAQATRIPVPYVQAIEADQLDALPPGPYAHAYVRALAVHLGVDPSLSDEDLPMPATPPQGAPLWLVRALAGLSLVALVGVLGSYAVDRLGPGLAMPSRDPDQRLAISVQRRTALRVEVDGVVALDRTVDGGEQLSFAASDRIALTLRSTSHVHLEWNGVHIVPQGRQDVPRELVFVDDRGLAGGLPW